MLVVCATVVVEEVVGIPGWLAVVVCPGLVDDIVCWKVVLAIEVGGFGSTAVVVPVVDGELVVCGRAVLGIGEVVVVPVGPAVAGGEPVGNSTVISINKLMISLKKLCLLIMLFCPTQKIRKSGMQSFQ